jgi:hypothetical protein
MKVEDLYDLYGHLQGQVSVAINVSAAIAALHPGRQTIENIIGATAESTDPRRRGNSAEQAYAAGIDSAVAVFRAALKGMGPPPPEAH